jgi:hypothetical protein
VVGGETSVTLTEVDFICSFSVVGDDIVVNGMGASSGTMLYAVVEVAGIELDKVASIDGTWLGERAVDGAGGSVNKVAATVEGEVYIEAEAVFPAGQSLSARVDRGIDVVLVAIASMTEVDRLSGGLVTGNDIERGSEAGGKTVMVLLEEIVERVGEGGTVITTVVERRKVVVPSSRSLPLRVTVTVIVCLITEVSVTNVGISADAGWFATVEVDAFARHSKELPEGVIMLNGTVPGAGELAEMGIAVSLLCRGCTTALVDKLVGAVAGWRFGIVLDVADAAFEKLNVNIVVPVPVVLPFESVRGLSPATVVGAVGRARTVGTDTSVAVNDILVAALSTVPFPPTEAMRPARRSDANIDLINIAEEDTLLVIPRPWRTVAAPSARSNWSNGRFGV